jgi:tubulin monoglycylase TTLL15
MEMISNPSDIAVNLDSCIKNNCKESCFKPECELCLNCLKTEQIADFHETYREHSRRGGFKRVFPSKSHPTAQKLSPRSEMVAKWLEAKCGVDENWC